jgi:N-methylhydantoinase A
MANGWQVGIDIGGTFTDVVALKPGNGEVRAAKVDTQSDDRVAGLLAALAAVGLNWADVDDLIHGTTMVTNAIVEGHLAKVALITTEGFSDTLAIGRQNRSHLYRLDLPPKIEPQVPAERRFEIAERLDHHGHVLKALDVALLDSVAKRIKESGTEAVAVSLLHSYADPIHEEAIGQRLREKFPYIALSNRVNPEAREFERTATTVLSASAMPLAAGYLESLEAAKPRESRLHLFHSAGGMASPEALRERPLGLALSGPAAGVAAASNVASQLGIREAISFDMGGTTTDVCLILDGRAQISSDRSLGGRPMRQPMMAVDSIGAGGGSIARLDHGALLVGPESAGADPGPACYGRGGKRATVSDANLVLGYMDPARVLGSGVHLDIEKSLAVLGPLAYAMGMTVEAAALGIVTVANSAMVRALRRTTVERGIDGRHCILLAFGGAGPMHAVEVARAFGIAKVVVPAHSSAFSALGCVSAEMSYSQQRTVRMRVDGWDTKRLDEIRQSLHSRLAAPLKAAGFSDKDLRVQEVAAIRYSGQSYAIEITSPTFHDPAQLGKDFIALHEKLYGFATDEPWQLEAIRRRVSVPRVSGEIGALVETGAPSGPVKTTPCIFDARRTMPTPRFNRAGLAIGKTLQGPAIVEDGFSTVVVPPGAALSADSHGHLHIATGAP